MSTLRGYDARVRHTFIETAQAPNTKGMRRQRSDGMLLQTEHCSALMEWSAHTWSAKPVAVAPEEAVKDQDGWASTDEDSGAETCWSSERSSEDSPSATMTQLPQLGLPEGTVTVIVRHVPHKYTQKALMHEISTAGFHGTFDLFYLPLESRANRSRGFAFINFKSARDAQDFHQRFDGRALQQSTTGIPVKVLPSELQGMEAMLAHFDALAESHKGKPRARGQPYFAKKVSP